MTNKVTHNNVKFERFESSCGISPLSWLEVMLLGFINEKIVWKVRGFEFTHKYSKCESMDISLGISPDNGLDKHLFYQIWTSYKLEKLY